MSIGSCRNVSCSLDRVGAMEAQLQHPVPLQPLCLPHNPKEDVPLRGPPVVFPSAVKHHPPTTSPALRVASSANTIRLHRQHAGAHVDRESGRGAGLWSTPRLPILPCGNEHLARVLQHFLKVSWAMYMFQEARLGEDLLGWRLQGHQLHDGSQSHFRTKYGVGCFQTALLRSLSHDPVSVYLCSRAKTMCDGQRGPGRGFGPPTASRRSLARPPARSAQVERVPSSACHHIRTRTARGRRRLIRRGRGRRRLNPQRSPTPPDFRPPAPSHAASSDRWVFRHRVAHCRLRVPALPEAIQRH